MIDTKFLEKLVETLTPTGSESAGALLLEIGKPILTELNCWINFKDKE